MISQNADIGGTAPSENEIKEFNRILAGVATQADITRLLANLPKDLQITPSDLRKLMELKGWYYEQFIAQQMEEGDLDE